MMITQLIQKIRVTLVIVIIIPQISLSFRTRAKDSVFRATYYLELLMLINRTMFLRDVFVR
jgi:hypothetical protein